MKGIGLAGHVARVGIKKRIQGKTEFGGRRRRLENNIKIDLKGVTSEIVAFVLMVMNLSAGNSLCC